MSVTAMIEWFHELNQRDHVVATIDRRERLAVADVVESDWRAWWSLLDDLTPADHAMLSQWYDALHAS